MRRSCRAALPADMPTAPCCSSSTPACRPAPSIRRWLKDMLAVQSEIGRFGLDLPLIGRAVEQHRAHVAGGNEMADPASIVRLYEDKPTKNRTGRAQ